MEREESNIRTKMRKKRRDYTKQKREGSKRGKNERNGMEMRERVSWEF